MQTHRFIQIDDLATGQSFVREMSPDDAARRYPTDILLLLDMGHTVRISDELHCDMQAHLRAHRLLPLAMTRKPFAPVIETKDAKATAPEIQTVMITPAGGRGAPIIRGLGT